MEELNNVIQDYLKAVDTDYVIMINGDWGCGKSYYIKHNLPTVAANAECPSPNDDRQNKLLKWGNKQSRELALKMQGKEDGVQYDEKHYCPFYISLYGVSSVSDFYCRVLEGVFGMIGTGGNALQSVMETMVGTRVPVNAGMLIPYNAVLVFDDLERICLDKISPIEVLGLINTFSEHRNIKVVIVCNEEAFRKKTIEGNIQLALDDEYRQYKEKTVRFTYTCKADMWDVYHVLLSKYKEKEYGAYIEECTERILALFGIGGKSNIRTLKFFIEIYEKLYNEVTDLLTSDARPKILDRLLTTTLIYVMEYKQGVSPKDLLRLREPIADTLAEMYEGVTPMELEAEPERETYQIDKVQERYEQYYEDMVRLPWLIDYIASGALNTYSVRDFATKLEAELLRIESSPAMQAMEKIKNLRTIDDEELEPTVQEIWNYIEQNEYTVAELLDIYSTFVTYTINRIDGFAIPEEKDDVFKEALNIAGGLGDCQADEDAGWLKRSSTSEIHQLKKRYYELVKYVKKLQAESNKAQYAQMIDGFLQEAEEKGGSVEGVAIYQETEKAFSLRGMDWDRLFNAIVAAPNPKACMIIDTVEQLIKSDGAKWTDEEQLALHGFWKKIREYMTKKSGKVRVYVMRGLERTVNEFLRGEV